ncbi:MAG: recombinase family protein, partial [Oscillospiraceae bacterium]|nr:recombinase family protein [Oscillospiraceae bacterium]
MKGVIYARYSSDNQREESIEGQLRECKEYAERNGITILKTYVDRALSAKTDHRPDFQNMIKDSGKGLFDVVIVWKLDRFARNRYDSAHYKSVLRKNGVKVVSAKEAIAEDSTGILLESLLEGYAEFYSAELSEKVIRGLTDNALKTKYNGGGVPIGYIIDKEQHFQLDPVTSPLVLEAFTLYDKGATMKELVDYLFEKGLCDRNSRPLKIDVVARLLKNRRYIGEYRYREIVRDGAIPAIVPVDLFDRVQERMVKNKKAPARKKAKAEEYLLTTKLFCGYCSAPMVGESGTSRTNTVHRYYKCANVKKKKGCHKKSVKKEWIEDLVLTETMNMVFNDGMMEALADNLVAFQRRENTSLPLLKRQLTETAQGIDNLLNAIQQGILTPSTKTRLEELEETKAQLEISILQAEMEKPPISREQFLFWLHRFRGIDISQPDQRQRLIDSFVNAIYLYDDKIVLTFNYQDGTKTITLEQVSGSDLGAGTAPRRSEIRSTPFQGGPFWGRLKTAFRSFAPPFQ